MSHADWRRYFAIIYDRPFPEPTIFKHRERCLEHMAYMMFEHVKTFGASPKPIGVVRIRGRKRHVQVQHWLRSRAQ